MAEAVKSEPQHPPEYWAGFRDGYDGQDTRKIRVIRKERGSDYADGVKEGRLHREIETR